MVPTDVIGNPLMKGDLVMVTTRSKEQFIGEVVEVNEGGLIAPAGSDPKNQVMMQGRIVVSLKPMMLFFDPKAPLVPEIVKMIRPPQLMRPQS